jgi:hypothetical protein
MTALINLTPHTVHLFTALSSESPTAIPSTGIARVAEICFPSKPLAWDPSADSGMHLSVPLVSKGYGDVTGLPDTRLDTLYIVSAIVQAACPDRADLVAPHDIVRDASGAILGCRAFSRPEVR